MVTERKRCKFGKSCSATCISKNFFCIVELGPEIAKMLKQSRDLVRGVHGKKDNRGDRGHYFVTRLDVKKAEELAKQYKSLPKNHPDRSKIAEQIKDLGFKVGSMKGYDDLRIRMRSPNFDINKHYD